MWTQLCSQRSNNDAENIDHKACFLLMNFQSCFAFLGWTNSPKISGSFRMIGERWDNFVTIALPCLNMFHFDNWTSIAGFLLRSYVSKPRFLWLRPMISMTPKRINWQVTKRSGKSTKHLLYDPLEVLNTLNTSSHSIHQYPYTPQKKVEYYNPSHFGHRFKESCEVATFCVGHLRKLAGSTIITKKTPHCTNHFQK